jgi:hypothetical protein
MLMAAARRGQRLGSLGGAGTTCGADRRPFWSWLTRDSSPSAAAAATLRHGGEGLPTPEQAQRLEVVRLPGLLSDDEIRQVLRAAADIRRDGAGAVRMQSQPAAAAATRAAATDSASSAAQEAITPLPSWDPEGYETDRGDWTTTYLHTMHMFQRRLPELHAKIRTAALRVDAEHWGIVQAALAASVRGGAAVSEGKGEGQKRGSGDGCAHSPAAVATRCVELHTVGPSGGLPHPLHYDAGSCVTIDIMLGEPSSGGEFQTLEAAASGSGGPSEGAGWPRTHEFRRGDAVIFPSHKYHSVQPVKEGWRQVLIMELWIGEERGCNHRCEQHFGPCREPLRGMWNASTGSYVAW